MSVLTCSTVTHFKITQLIPPLNSFKIKCIYVGSILKLEAECWLEESWWQGGQVEKVVPDTIVYQKITSNDVCNNKVDNIYSVYAGTSNGQKTRNEGWLYSRSLQYKFLSWLIWVTLYFLTLLALKQARSRTISQSRWKEIFIKIKRMMISQILH